MEFLFDRRFTVGHHHICWGCKRELPNGYYARCIIRANGKHNRSSFWCATCEAILEAKGIIKSEGFKLGEVKELYPEWQSICDYIEQNISVPFHTGEHSKAQKRET